MALRRVPALLGSSVLATVLATVLAGCSGGDAGPAAEAPTGGATTTAEEERPADDPAYDVAVSEPVEDSVYPEVGDPGVDALHYDLDLTWDPGKRVLTGTQVLAFRAAETDDSVQLDLAPGLEVLDVSLGGEGVPFRHRGKDLVVETEVEEDERYLLEVGYAGEPQPVPAPTTRADIPGLGLTVAADGTVWTMQEPFGAYTWYAVNDQPADKALYDFTLRVAGPMVGVANGELVSRRSRDGEVVTRWSLDQPAASYLVTVAFGEFETVTRQSKGGVPVTVWASGAAVPRLAQLGRSAAAALDWAEERLGPYPYDTLGFLFVPSESGMETQTMVTLGTTEYAMSDPVLVHEVVHHWWGNQVTPTDWRDLWMNEGMTMYLQAIWQSENGEGTLEAIMTEWRGFAQELRTRSGPPGDYDPQTFADGNVYYLPALLWHDVRARLGDETFFRLLREWPAAHDDQNVDRDDLVAWWERESGTGLADLFRSHLLDEQQPGSA